ncbi:MAG: PD40 domain-containing protein [Anaerolineae bacterium]|nr:PD40 domain-containing protein [Anaerolineae bacterium]
MIREHLLKGRRVFLVAGEPRMGKSSVLRQLLHDVPEGFLPVRLDLREEAGQSLDTLAWHIASAVADHARRSIGAEIDDPVWSDFEGHTNALLDQFWPALRRVVGGTCVVLLADDVDALDCAAGGLCDRLLSLIEAWRDRDPDLALVAAMTEGSGEVLRSHPQLFGGALTHTLAPLQSEEALRLITWPVDGALTYDYGVARRIVEVTSGHPYYLQLVCFEIYHRCSAAGWVNQRDVDLVIEELVRREIPDFCDMWQASSPAEQAVLAAMVSLRGARGVATVQEVRTVLNRAGARVERERVAEILDRLAARGVLERLGALSYRFRVALQRDWLVYRVDLRDTVRHARWDAPLDRRASGSKKPVTQMGMWRRTPAPTPAEGAPAQSKTPTGTLPPQSPASAGQVPSARPIPWLGLAAAVALIAMVLILLRPRFLPGTQPDGTVAPTLPPATLVTPRASSFPVAQPTATAAPLPTVVGTAAGASPVPTAAPSLTPSPTPPVVVARSLPAIAYQAREEGQSVWSLYVMNSDGSNRTLLTRGQTTFLSAPSWSPHGDRIAFVSDRAGSDDIWVMDLDGENAVNLTANEVMDHSPAWSPDGEWIAFASVRDAPYWELYMIHPDGSDLRRLTWWEDASDIYPTWSPDSTRLAFASKRDGNWEIYVMNRDGSGLARLTDHPADDDHPAWSPDGGRIAFVSLRDGYAEIYVVGVGGGEPVNISQAPFSTELGPTWSPDGSRIAFYSDREGEWDIYVMASDGSDVVRLTGEGTSDQVPAWRP